MPDYQSEIDRLEKEIRETPYNKATQHHIGLIKAKIAKLRQKQEQGSGGKGGREGYSVRKTGDGTVILLGFPSTGKSTLLNKLCGTESETGAYAFTTLSVVPGTLQYRFARIQILDVPGIVQGAASGRGRGKEVLGCIRNADLCLLIADCTKPHELPVVRKEAENAGIRLNTRRPDVQITKRGQGGINVLSTVRLSELDEKTIEGIFKEFRMPNADIVIREDINAGQLIDCIEDNKKYLPALTVFNKMDLISHERRRELQKEYRPDLFVSAARGKNIDQLRDMIYEKLRLMSIYLKEPGKEADMKEPLILARGSTIRDVCQKLHRDFVDKFKFARVWGESSKFPGQKLMLNHPLEDSDVLELHMR